MDTEKKPRRSGLQHARTAVLVLMVLLILGQLLYLFCVYTDNSFVAKWRRIYIETAMTTYSHQWLATAFIPQSVIDENMSVKEEANANQSGINTQWNTPENSGGSTTISSQLGGNADATPIINTEDKPSDSQNSNGLTLSEEQIAFFETFYQIEPASMLAYTNTHPEVLENGWSGINLNQAALYDDGTSIRTTEGDEVLAIDAANGILLIRVKGEGYRGVLAIAKDSSMLSLHAGKGIGRYGSLCKDIAKDAGALLAINGSAFYDPDGTGNGGELCGYAVCEGEHYGYIAGNTSFGSKWKRIELREDNLMYVVDSYRDVDPTTTDAVEFEPALIIDGEILVNEAGGWGIHPRTAIGMSDQYEVMMIIIEGRQPLKGIIGTTPVEVAKQLKKYNCAQAMLHDGGSSAIMVYHGESVTMCSNGFEEGRAIPNAWVIVPNN